MKRIIFLVSVLGSSLFVFAQSRNHNNMHQPPTTVQQAWQRDHANDGKPEWQQVNGQWHAKYKSNNHTADSYYDSRGRQMDTHTAWDRKDVPQNVDKHIRSRYHTGNYQVTRIDRPDNSPSLFQIVLNLGKTKKTIYTDENGNERKYKDSHHW